MCFEKKTNNILTRKLLFNFSQTQIFCNLLLQSEIMKAFLSLLYPLFLFASYSCVTPINMTQDRAKTLGKNYLEVAGSYSKYTDEDNNQVGNNNYGGRIGFGVSPNVDIKARYERLVSTKENGGAANYLSVFPKINLLHQKISLLLPVSSYFGEAIFKDDSRYSIAPEVIGTYTFGSNADVSGMIKGDYFFSTEDRSDEFYWGFKIGFGLSSNLDKWAIRPEAGYMFNPNDPGQIWSFGVGLIYNFTFQKPMSQR
jgi:hypothetical protein